MKSRAARLALLVLFVLALGVTAYLFLKSESGQRTQLTAGQVFSERGRVATRGVLDLRAAQQAYVATGQGEEFWTKRVSGTLATLREALTTLRSAAASPEAQAQIDGASGSLQDFGQMDARAREYVRTGQKLTAADMIFSNGSELTDAALMSIDRATAAELDARAAAAATLERRQTFALVSAVAAAVLVVLLLLPTGEPPLAVPAFLERAEPATSRSPLVTIAPRPLDPAIANAEGWTPPRKAGEPAIGAVVADAAAGNPADATPVEEPHEEPLATLPPLPPPAFDFGAVASLCTDLSAVEDLTALAPLLERAAVVLDASGLILWMADPEGRELTPVLAHGYSQHLINRLGTIARGAENATAAAFRTGLLQTVSADDTSAGAIAVPLVAAGGCVGVMAVEVRNNSEKREATLSAATILSAQLASLVGPSSARQPEPEVVEAANA